jgi:hypothetical protein
MSVGNKHVRYRFGRGAETAIFLPMLVEVEETVRLVLARVMVDDFECVLFVISKAHDAAIEEDFFEGMKIHDAHHHRLLFKTIFSKKNTGFARSASFRSKVPRNLGRSAATDGPFPELESNFRSKVAQSRD